ncbi:MAG TPA: saccharopine dehydrogenase [Rhodospirillaceae bacterium]|nr:saccharopine dehydrogenase [Rhodospirillaceae bacterium]
MSKDPQVVVYGAGGYTGKQVAWKLAERRIPFVAAGRDGKRLKEQLARVPELKGADYQVAEADLDEKKLTALFQGKTAVYNLAGPFMQLSEPVVKAALAAGIHYLDSTGEPDWMRYIRDKYGAKFAKKNLVLAPACSWMWTIGNIAAEIALETPGIDSLDLAYLADSNTSVASTKSFFRMLVKPQLFIKNNKLEAWPSATSFPVAMPGMSRILPSLPWGGGAEPVWYEGDARVRNCAVLVAFNRPEMMQAIVDILIDFEKKHQGVSDAKREQLTNELGLSLVSSEPEREDADENRSMVVCHARGRTAGVTVVMRGYAPYAQTAIFAAHGLQTLLANRQQGAGFLPPAKAFGARQLLAAIADDGTNAWEVKVY